MNRHRLVLVLAVTLGTVTTSLRPPKTPPAPGAGGPLHDNPIGVAILSCHTGHDDLVL